VYVTPAPAAPINWTTVSPAAEDALAELARDRKSEKKATRRSKGVPAAPALVAAANSTAISLTAAYQIGGLSGVGGLAGIALGGSTAGILKRRATVRK
jgi:hypothetical protein